jgi:hypothetical protein
MRKYNWKNWTPKIEFSDKNRGEKEEVKYVLISSGSWPEFFSQIRGGSSFFLGPDVDLFFCNLLIYNFSNIEILIARRENFHFLKHAIFFSILKIKTVESRSSLDAERLFCTFVERNNKDESCSRILREQHCVTLWFNFVIIGLLGSLTQCEKKGPWDFSFYQISDIYYILSLHI